MCTRITGVIVWLWASFPTPSASVTTAITTSIVVNRAVTATATISTSYGKCSYGLSQFLLHLVRVLCKPAYTSTACEVVDTPLGSIPVTRTALVVHLEDHLAIHQFAEDGLRLAKTYSMLALQHVADAFQVRPGLSLT